MFRQEESFIGGWHERTMEFMNRRRFEQLTAQLPPLGAHRLGELPADALRRRLEQCWQDIPIRTMRAQQEEQAIRSIIGSIQLQADCLSGDEHDLVERMLILGGCAEIEDTAELEAARALSLRLWANVGLVSGRPYIELEPVLAEPVACAFAKAEHEAVRERFVRFHERMCAALYRVGAMDDRQPQQLILRDVLDIRGDDELSRQMARRYLWASYDCIDYSGGVMLVHGALADPRRLLPQIRRQTIMNLKDAALHTAMDILPEEIPLQHGLERAIQGALRGGVSAQDIARSIRFLCKQGAPLCAMESVLQSSLIVYLTDAMRGALQEMYYMTPKWIECMDSDSLQ